MIVVIVVIVVVVVDVSALAAVLFDEPAGAAMVDRLVDHELHVPAVFYFELTNIACAKIRMRPADKPAFEASLQDGLAYPISVDRVDFLEVLRLAIATKLSAYDASYLWLARRLDVPLVTLDKKLAAHATRR